MCPTTRRDGEATRQKLLRAALELYTTAGFSDTTTPEIAARAGVAEGTIYRHFAGKEDLLNAVYRAAQRWALGVIVESDGDHTVRAPERLQHIARRLLDAAEHDPAGARMVLQFRDDRYLDDKSRDAAREVREALQQVVAAGKSDGLVRTGPADLWVAVWLAIVAFAVERVCAKEWTPQHPQAVLAVEAAWKAISA
jgi:AcrR family transcriptional regulator